MKDAIKDAVEPFKVYIRIRPLLERELKLIALINQENPNKQIDKSTLAVEHNTIYLKDPSNAEFYGKSVKEFSFDHVFTEEAQNKAIFDSIIKKHIDNMFNGYNSTALAYGITGTGKTHTMFGDIYRTLSLEKGVCMYSVDYLFDRIASETSKVFNAKVSYLEICNEQVLDLLTEKRSNEGIMIVEDPKKGVSVPDLTQKAVLTSDEVLSLIVLGNQRRTMGPTGQNQFSSRSHAILEISIEQRASSTEDAKVNQEELIFSKITFVDLAGSERGGLEKGIRREEGSNINKSLLALGNCINILSDKSKKSAFVPYRDSKLTRLLKESLGGNISTLMIACVTPSPINYEETNSTLNYASRANKIEKTIRRNIREVDQYTSQCRDIITSLRSEVAQLKEIISRQHMLLQFEPCDSFRNELNTENGLICDDFFKEDADEIEKLEKNRVIDLLNPIEGNYLSDKHQPLLLNCNWEAYEHFLKSNSAELSEEEFEDFGAKMEALHVDKEKLAEMIQRGLKDGEIKERYMIIKAFYEKFLELVNDKLIENIEQSVVLKFVLKELLEKNEAKKEEAKENEEMLNSIEFKDDDEENTINQRERIELQSALEQNLKVKSFLKKLLLRFISNTQLREIKELQEHYTSLINSKRELEIKNKKYQEYLSSVMKEKDSQSQKIADLFSEIAQMRKQLSQRDKRIRDLEGQLKTMELHQNEISPNMLNAKTEETLKKNPIKRLLKYFNDCNLRSYLRGRMRNEWRILNRPYKRRNNRAVTNNFISINLNTKIPTLTAFIQGGDVFTKDNQSNEEKECVKVIRAEYKAKKSTRKKKRRSDESKEKPLTLNQTQQKNDSMDNIRDDSDQKRLYYSVLIGKEEKARQESKSKEKESLLKLEINLKGKNTSVEDSNQSITKKRRLIIMNSTKAFKAKPMLIKEKAKESNVMNDNIIDNISLSAVTFNNEAIINSSALDMMNNVLSIEGLKDLITGNKP